MIRWLRQWWIDQSPHRHCFRENGCARHGSYPDDAPNLCCCCGQSPEVHSGCDCS